MARLAALLTLLALAWWVFKRGLPHTPETLNAHEHDWYVTGYDFSPRCSVCERWEEQVQPTDERVWRLLNSGEVA